MARLAQLASTLLLGVLLGALGTFYSLQAPAPPAPGAARFLSSALRLRGDGSATVAGDGGGTDSYPVAKLEPTPKVCVVAGVGPGIGESVARRFAAGGCRVALLARHADVLAKISETMPGSRSYVCDVTDSGQVESTFSRIRADLGDVDAMLYNVGGGRFLGYENITGDTLEMDFRSNALGLLLTAQQVGPQMAARGHGVIGVTGATSSWRGLSYTAGFAPGKFAARGLAESLARDLGPKGVHVFHAVIDGPVSASHPNTTADKSLHPEDIAETYYNLALQPRSAWTFEVSMFAWADPTWYSI